jgi:hypothetical protein
MTDLGIASRLGPVNFTAERAVQMLAFQFVYLVITALLAVALYRIARYAAAIRQRKAIAQRQ